MNVEHERAHALEQLLESAGARYTPPPAAWKTHSLLVQAVFFVLTAIAIAAFYFLLDQLDVPKEGIVTGLAALALAEYLIRVRRWFGTGVEAALWIGGLFALISELPRTGTPESLLVMASAAAIAGARVRQPLFGAGAACLIVEYFENRLDLGVVAGLAIATIAVLALLRTWQRPSNEWLWIALALVMPIAARLDADPAWRWLTIALYAVFGVATLILAIRVRHHALLLASMIAIAIAAGDFREMLPLRLEAKLALAGACLLAIAFFVSRALRGRTTGIVAIPAKLTAIDDVLEIGGTLAAGRAAGDPPAADDSRPQGEGGFGGAGASGNY